MSDIEISAELTPNPNTLRFVVNRELLAAGSRDFPNAESAKDQPLPGALFEIEHVAGVLIGTDFITVTKKSSIDWPVAAVPVVEKIRVFLQTGQPVVLPLSSPDDFAGDPLKMDSRFRGNDTTIGGIEDKICEILDNEIRPAVARDGGDIIFYGYENGVVKLHLQGSCSSCPSSVMTLKVGIESRLKMAFPEIKEVIQV